MKVTLGGDRLGSGNKNKQYLRNYERSTHNLSQKFTSSMQVGTLYPFLVLPAMRGDSFTINLDADARTIPTKAPLFGSFKMQIDVFQYPVRLAQAILHNNPIDIGLGMKNVKFPVIDMQSRNTHLAGKFADNSLIKYLGASGMGTGATANMFMNRKFNAIPILAYYEIFKTYYANKQEENAYIIGAKLQQADENNIIEAYSKPFYENDHIPVSSCLDTYLITSSMLGRYHTIVVKTYDPTTIDQLKQRLTIYLEFKHGEDVEENYMGIDQWNSTNIGELFSVKQIKSTEYEITLDQYKADQYGVNEFGDSMLLYAIKVDSEYYNTDFYLGAEMIPFPLKNIDHMRLKLLSFHDLGNPFHINNNDEDIENFEWNKLDGEENSNGLPYTAICDLDQNTNSLSCYPMQGLCVKTYQSDINNNWIKTEWIDGENGISAVTAISTASGSIKIDAINLAEKLYNMLNRVAVADGTFEGWENAVYTETPKRHIESPIYLGGMSNEIVFEEIVQTSSGGDGLGTLAGKGKLLKRKGGYINVKCNEASFIIGIVSLTPRINYSQGNEFYMTDLMSMDDFHKPALDGIGFQNLIGERLAYFDTIINSNGTITRHTIGKIPAWLEYMTAVDKTYGDFASPENENGCMVLNRNYEQNGQYIKDATTYIDPRKYNYAFAYTEIDSQNFWVQIYSDIKARRLMSAKQIPNL